MATEGPTSPPSPSPRKRPADGVRQTLEILDMPFMLVAWIVFGGGIGYFLDKRFHTSPLLTLILGLLGFAGGMIQLVKRLSKDS